MKTLLIVIMVANLAQLQPQDVSVDGDMQGVTIQESNGGKIQIVTDKFGTQYVIDLASRKQYVIFPDKRLEIREF